MILKYIVTPRIKFKWELKGRENVMTIWQGIVNMAQRLNKCKMFKQFSNSIIMRITMYVGIWKKHMSNCGIF